MSRRTGLSRLALAVALTAVCSSSQTTAGDDAIWREFGLVKKSSAKIGKTDAIVYRMKDATGAVAAWEWQRPVDARSCSLESFCSVIGKQTVVAAANYLIALHGPVSKLELDAFLPTLPNRRDSSLPAILTYVPRKNLIPNSARYVLGPSSYAAFATSLAAIPPGFDQGVEAQVADYRIGEGQPLHLAVFYYPTPELARLYLPKFKALPNAKVKRSSVLLAVIFGGAGEQQANALLGQIGYEAKIVWNEIPPPSPIKPLYLLLRNIILLSVVLVVLCFVSGLVYAGIRLYRRKFGSLEDDEAMTTLHLSGR